MKKIIVLMLAALLAVSMFSGCNQQLIDITYNYDWAMVELPGGQTVEGEVDSWKDYEDSDQIQVVIDGVTYLTHAENVVLISRKK